MVALKIFIKVPVRLHVLCFYVSSHWLYTKGIIKLFLSFISLFTVIITKMFLIAGLKKHKKKPPKLGEYQVERLMMTMPNNVSLSVIDSAFVSSKCMRGNERSFLL